jgi:hypothetical protein
MSGSPQKSTPAYGYCSITCGICRHTYTTSVEKSGHPRHHHGEPKSVDHRLSHGSRTPGAPNKILGCNIGTLSKNQATRMDPKENSPYPVDRHGPASLPSWHAA